MLSWQQWQKRIWRAWLAHWKCGLTNALVKGLDSVFRATRREARGYRSSPHFSTMLDLIAGKLRLPQY